MAAVGAHAALYHHDAAYSMSSYYSHGGSSTSSSSSSFSAALAAPPPPPPIADPSGGAQFDISEFFFDDDAPPPPQPPANVFNAAARATRSVAEVVPVPAPAAMERPRTERIAFRTRTEIEILDDGYKWRKYGKKSVKNSPNPRNYYRCSTEGCNVKKRVERDKDDPSYVVTTYEGTHNHVSPSTVYYASQDAASGRFFVAGTQPPGSLN
uniref:WRKY domain-containing protein n=1 Tax=Leersia perrieri TaxID=77586 RepID=A0A0D9WJ39_9ORYZ